MSSNYKIETFEDLLKALKERPDWLEELRRIILTEELISLPQKFEKFRKEEFQPLKEKVDKIEQDVAILKQDVAILKQDVALLKQDVALLKQDVALLKQDVADLKGDNFERKVRERAPSYFGKLIRKCRLISSQELADILDDAMDNEIISESERDDALNADVVVTGFLKHDKKKVVLVTEVSIKIDKTDVEKAFARAEVIGKAMNFPAIPVVIGKEFTEGAKTRAEELKVILC
ncbi:MAG: hypothetical protein QXE51_00985 [Nitrososphaeria archaeon]